MTDLSYGLLLAAAHGPQDRRVSPSSKIFGVVFLIDTEGGEGRERTYVMNKYHPHPQIILAQRLLRPKSGLRNRSVYVIVLYFL